MAKKRRNIQCLKERKKEMKMAQKTQTSQANPVVQITQEQLDVIVIDLTLRELFNNGDKTVIDFNKDVIEKYNIPNNERSLKRYWDILDATQFVNPVVGFGNANKLSITTQGYSVMLQFGNYQNYINSLRAHTQQQIQQPEATVEDVEVENIEEENTPIEDNNVVRKKRDDKTF